MEIVLVKHIIYFVIVMLVLHVSLVILSRDDVQVGLHEVQTHDKVRPQGLRKFQDFRDFREYFSKDVVMEDLCIVLLPTICRSECRS